MDPDQAAKEAIAGGLVGMGCEAHESKVAAKLERLVEKRKHRAEARKVGKVRKVEGRSLMGLREEIGDGGGVVAMDEEERFVAMA